MTIHVNISQGYLGDNGPSTTGEFSFNLAGFSNFFMVFQQVFPGADGIGCSFSFRVDYGFCNQAADLAPIFPDVVKNYGPNTDEFLAYDEM